MFALSTTAAGTVTRPWLTDTCSIGTTASAPVGTTPPVDTAIASPDRSTSPLGRPAAASPTIARVPGTSSTRIAYPSMLELGNGGRSIAATAGSASTRPSAASVATSSVGSTVACARTVAIASSTEVSRATRQRYLVVDRVYRVVISVVVPVRDEEPSVEPLYRELAQALDPIAQWEVVYVDDGSLDGTFSELTALHAAHMNVRVVRLRKHLGKAAALDAGLAEAAGDIVVTIDGDLQDDPAEIPRLRQARRGLRPRQRLEGEQVTRSPAGFPRASSTVSSVRFRERGSTT